MRQAMLVLAIAIAIGSPLAIAQTATGAVKPATPPQQNPSAAADASSARKPLSPIGRALAELMVAANQQRTHAHADANAIDASNAGGARLAAETEHGSAP